MSRSLLTNETSELDLLDQRPFDQTDFDILKSYEAVVDGLAMLIGSHCEIVLHSLQDLKCSAIRIANGEHTGRKIGSPITDLALRMLHDMTGADSSVSKCYFTRAKSGVLMKSLTIAINEITPADWENIRDNEIPKKMDSIMILSGEKKYKKD